MKRKKCYEKPLVERNYVELEDGVCSPGSFVKDTNDVQAHEHEDGKDLEYSSDGTWGDGLEEWK